MSGCSGLTALSARLQVELDFRLVSSAAKFLAIFCLPYPEAHSVEGPKGTKYSFKGSPLSRILSFKSILQGAHQMGHLWSLFLCRNIPRSVQVAISAHFLGHLAISPIWESLLILFLPTSSSL